MAQDYIHNFDKLSSQGYKQPANNPDEVSPDYLTHCQLRYSPFTSSEAIAGTVVTGETSTFVFSIPDGNITSTFKMYVSTDNGTTYTEDKTFGGSSGKKLFGANDLSNYVALTGAQSITGTKTISGSANLVIASGSDITVQAGGDITLADAPSASTDAVNKAYVDGLVGWKTCVFWIDSFTPNESIALSYRRIYNNTGVTPTLTYGTSLFGAQGLRVTFNRTSAASDLILPGKLHTDDGFGSKNAAGFLSIDETWNQASSNTTVDLFYVDDIATNWDISTANFGGIDIWSKYTLSGGTLTRAAGSTAGSYTDQMFLAATKPTGTGSYLAAALLVATSEARKNFRIELRFYD